MPPARSAAFEVAERCVSGVRQRGDPCDPRVSAGADSASLTRASRPSTKVFALAVMGRPGEIAWVGVTVARYAAWFVVGGSRAELWQTSLAALVMSVLGVALGVRLAKPPALAAGATALATAGAFAVQAWRADAFVPALALPYALAFAAYCDPAADDLIPYFGAVVAAGAIYLAVRFALWPGRRRIDLAALVEAHERNSSICCAAAAARGACAVPCGGHARACWRPRRACAASGPTSPTPWPRPACWRRRRRWTRAALRRS